MPTFQADELRKIGAALFQAAGAPSPIAAQVAASLVENNLVGHDSHGVLRIASYVDYIKQGRLNPAATPSVLRETPNTAIVSGNRGFGQIAARFSMELAIAKARRERLAAVGIVECDHIGRLGEYAMMAVDQGMIGIVFVGLGAGMAAIAAPYGGIGRALGTNPLAVAVPAGEMPPVLVDIATTIVAEGKLRVARSKHAAVPEGLILDKEGRPTTDPEDFYSGGMMLPFGGHKGYSLSVLMDLFGGALTGAFQFDSTDRGNGTFMMAIDVQAFRPLEEFRQAVDKECRRLKAIPPAPGFSEVLVPGEPELRTREQRLKEGIYIPDDTWQALLNLGKDFDIPVERMASPK